MTTNFDFNGSGRLERERNLYQGGGRWSKIRRGVGVGSEYYSLLLSPLPSPAAATISKSDMDG